MRLAMTWVLTGALTGMGVTIWALPGQPSSELPRPQVNVEPKGAQDVPAPTERGVKNSDNCLIARTEVSALRKQLEQLEREYLPQAPSSPLQEAPNEPGCRPGQWPPDLSENYREDALRAQIVEQFPDVEFEMDCSEFPCLAMLEDVDSGSAGVQKIKSGGLAKAETIEMNWVGPGPDGIRRVHLLAVLPPESMSEDLRERVDARIGAQVQDFMRMAHDARSVPEDP